jgi:transposase-like protein
MTKRRRTFPAEEKARILRRHLVENVAVSDLCDEYNIKPTVLYGWQRKLFENAAFALERRTNNPTQESIEAKRIAALEKKLAKKDEVLAELMEEYVTLKKGGGEI